ncbi:MAG: site-specific integrase [Phycisphaerales bacterium JB060]
MIALARWGGLRTPSETLRVQWVDVDWGRGRLRVRSPKTEAHAGKADRIIPLFPELRRVLQEAFEAAPDGAVHVVGGYRDATAANLRTQLLRIIDRAGLVAWPRLFNAMRASRATELAAEYPVAVCTAWMGHTAAVAEAHYHMVRESDYEKAASERPRQSRSESDVSHPDAASRTTPHNGPRGVEMRGGAVPCGEGMSATGLEPVTSAM